MIAFCKKHYIAASLLFSAAATIPVIFVFCIAVDGLKGVLTFFELLPFWYFPIVLFCAYPFVLTLIEVGILFAGWRKGGLKEPGRRLDLITILMGGFYTPIYLSVLKSVEFESDWNIAILETNFHTPIYSGSAPSLIVLSLVGFGGYLLLTWKPLDKLPPILIVFSIAGMYLLAVLSVVWCVQIMVTFDPFLILLPFNLVVITARTVRDKLMEWNALHPLPSPLSPLNRLLSHAAAWPLLGFLLMWPLLGVLICLLALFGQSPDAMIKAFTETSDWVLSQRISPQDLPYDGHYLCTVAAGGHPRMVKPLRKGIRHGHTVIVNRQLCVANAFEQVLEERTPRFHRAVRKFYDRHGLPIAKLIRSKYAADVVYLLMKPLEWVFLAVLYCVDANPENRIAVQYTGKRLQDFMEDAP